jgi:hypothetical protein
VRLGKQDRQREEALLLPHFRVKISTFFSSADSSVIHSDVRRPAGGTGCLSGPVGKFTRLRRDGYALSQGCKATNDLVYAYGRALELG